MDISNVKIRILNNEDSNLKAVASVVFDDVFCVHDIKIVKGDHGCFISMPSKKDKAGNLRDVAHPTAQDFRQKLQDTIIKEYQNNLARLSEDIK
mgnify:CR=1 FL=1